MDRHSGPRLGEADKPVGVRRLVDVAFGGLGLLAVAPIIVLLGLFVFLNLGRPILFAQYRAGRSQKPFLMIKLRSMLDRRDESGALLPDSERTTRFGGLLRRSRLDELPELWNVLKGDMSIVGPRPLLPETVAGMGELGVRRCRVRPGLTGWAQVSGNTFLSEDHKLALDLWYIDHRTLRLDLLIVVESLGLVVFGERVNHSRVNVAESYLSGWRASGGEA
jgi:lipopolysaccharide/colanic/teichoic acid biosynthesis glycosyltransferase